MGTSNLSYETLREHSSSRLSFEAIQTLDRGYLDDGETPDQMYERLCDGFVSYYPTGYRGFSPDFLWERLYIALRKGWISPASPVASNFNSNDLSAFPVSCFGKIVGNTLHDIFLNNHEAAMLTKAGGGLGIDLSLLIGASKVTSWARQLDVTMESTSQKGVRRGNVALYLDIDHPDFDLFIEAKDLLKGDVKTKLGCNIAVKISDDFIRRLKAGDKVAIRRFTKVLEMRLKYGSPYIFFSDTAQKADPEWYKALGLSTKHSQLCAEIMLHSDPETDYTCVLSSQNLYYFDEWSKVTDLSIPELGIIFLDAVNEQFIERATSYKFPQGYAKAVRGATLGRPLGLGVYGLHAWYMKRSIPFDSDAARIENLNIFQYIREEAEKATKQLAIEKGEPSWCKGYGRRNTHLLAIAPTTTSSILGGGITAGIQPIMGHYFSKTGAKGTFIRKNPILEEILEKYGKNTDAVWESIRKHLGSAQHLDFLTAHEKKVLETFPEINPEAIIDQAAERQQYIDQGQSLNLYFEPDEEAQKIVDIHLRAWEKGIKALYYVYSNSPLNEDLEDLNVFLRTREDCPYCVKAKKLLDERGIKYYTREKATGRVPEIWINGEQLEDGYNSLVQFFADQSGEIPSTLTKTDCKSCDG